MGSKKYYWLKLEKDFFKRHDIRIIEEMKNGKDYIIFYLKLILESMNHEGRLRFSDSIPYSEEMLSTITNTDIDVVRSAIKMFSSLELMEIWDDKTLYLVETSKMVGSETEWAKKKREYKNRIEVNVLPHELPNSYPYKLGNCTVVSHEQIILPNGKNRFVDEKRYDGNGKIVLAKSDGKCFNCKSEDKDIVIHHNNGYSNKLEDLVVLCKECHGKRHTRKLSDPSPIKVRQEIEKEKEIDIDNNNVESKDSTIPFKEVIKYLNEKANRQFRLVESNKKFIRARWNESYTLDDFKKVVDNKVAEWKDTDMDQYLRPSTLFGTKFDNYLNQTVKRKVKEIAPMPDFNDNIEVDIDPDEARRIRERLKKLGGTE